MADYKVYYKNGAEIKYFPDNNVLILNPGKSDKNQFLRMKSKLDTLLQVRGTKRNGNLFSLKLDDTFKVNIDELLKSLGMKGGLEQEDAQSMVDDFSKEDVEEQSKEQKADVDTAGMPQLESVIADGVYKFLFEDLFEPSKITQKRKATKRFGKYWKPIESFTGKNKNEVRPEDILFIRRKFSLKPASKERDLMLNALDKASNYFYGKLEKTKGIHQAEDFREEYLSIDGLKPEDYKIEDNNIDQNNIDANLNKNKEMSLMPDFDDISYDFDIER